MKILAIEKELSDLNSNQYELLLEAEADRVYQLYLEGIFREMYFDRDKHTAVIILECTHLQEAQNLIDTLPLVKAGLITFELHPLVPYTGLSRLLANNQDK